MNVPKILNVGEILDAALAVNYVRGRFSYDGLTPGRGELRYWLTDSSRFMNESERVVWVPPTPKLIEEKIALLDLSGRGERIIGVGKKQSSLVYYLHFTFKELQQMESEYEELRRRNPELVAGERVSRT